MEQKVKRFGILFNEISLCDDLVHRFARMRLSFNKGNMKEYYRYFDDVIFDLRELTDYSKSKTDKNLAKNIYHYFRDFISKIIKQENDKEFHRDFLKFCSGVSAYFENYLSSDYRYLAKLQKLHNELNNKYNINNQIKRSYEIFDLKQDDDLLMILDKIKEKRQNKLNNILNEIFYYFKLSKLLIIKLKEKDG